MSERGAALLEAMLALVVLATAGLALVALLDQAVHDEIALQGREHRLHEASEVLAAMVLLTRRELDLRLGRRPIGEFIVEVQRPEPTLYRVTVVDAEAPEVEMLVTLVHRPETRP